MSSASVGLLEVIIILLPSLPSLFLGQYKDQDLKFLDYSVLQGHWNKYTPSLLSSIPIKLFCISFGTKLSF